MRLLQLLPSCARGIGLREFLKICRPCSQLRETTLLRRCGSTDAMPEFAAMLAEVFLSLQAEQRWQRCTPAHEPASQQCLSLPKPNVLIRHDSAKDTFLLRVNRFRRRGEMVG